MHLAKKGHKEHKTKNVKMVFMAHLSQITQDRMTTSVKVIALKNDVSFCQASAASLTIFYLKKIKMTHCRDLVTQRAINA